MENLAFAFEKTLENKTKKDILAEKLIEMILTGLLRDGDVLPSERELAQLFGVSRETVRGALSRLTAHGLISVSHGSKTRIRASDEVLARFRSARSAETDGQVNRFDVDSVFESRIVVEAARRKKRLKHGGNWDRKELVEDTVAGAAPENDELIDIHEALNKLEATNTQAALLVSQERFDEALLSFS